MTKKHFVGLIKDIPEEGARIVNIDGREIGIFNIEGQLYALPNICFHQNGPLCRGKITGTLIANANNNFRLQWVYEGKILRCPWHSLEFNITTGQCLAFPNRRLRSYTVETEGDRVFLVV